jgi:hypothetical protein
MKVRVALATLAAFLGVVLFGVTGASAQRTPAPQLSTPITGTALGGAQIFNGTFRLKDLTHSATKVMAEGQLTGLLGNRKINTAVTKMPVALVPQTAAASTAAAPGAAAPTLVCPILNLVLGPLHLNLLGLVVDLNTVVLNITAIPGAGNLLGNLLCAVANLLNLPAFLPALTQLLAAINAILARA